MKEYWKKKLANFKRQQQQLNVRKEIDNAVIFFLLEHFTFFKFASLENLSLQFKNAFFRYFLK